MKTIEEFKEFYNQQLKNDLFELENIRKNTVSKVNNFFFIFSITLVPLVAVLFALFSYGMYYSTFFVFIIASIIYTHLYFTPKNEYTSSFTNLIIPKIISFINDTLRFYPKDFIDPAKFIDSCLFLRLPDLYAGKNLIKGKINNINLQLSEVYAHYEASSGPNYIIDLEKDGEKKVEVAESFFEPEKPNNVDINDIHLRPGFRSCILFRGLFFIADFNKAFPGKTFIFPDLAEKSLGHIGNIFQHLNTNHGELIKLEDPQFEKEFAVYGTDQVAARYILTTSFMERLTTFKRKLDRNICVSFIGSTMYLGIENLFLNIDPDINDSLLEFETLENYFEILLFIQQIVEDLNLSKNEQPKRRHK